MEFREVCFPYESTASSQEEFLDKLENGMGILVRNLEKVAKDIRHFKEIAVSHASHERLTFNLQSFLQDIGNSLRPQFINAGHLLEIRCTEPVEVSQFPGAILQVISNLAENSIQHGFEGISHGTVTIAVSCQDHKINLEFRDDGRGMDEQTRNINSIPFSLPNVRKAKRGLG